MINDQSSSVHLRIDTDTRVDVNSNATDSPADALFYSVWYLQSFESIVLGHDELWRLVIDEFACIY
jgi:hypothetical protein